MEWERIHQISNFNLCFDPNTKALKKNMIFAGSTIKSSDRVKLLGITLDRNINFKQHIENICYKANYKTKTLFHMMNF